MTGEASPYPPVPSSAAHLAEQVESGGARLEETLLRLNCKSSTLFFAAALSVFTGGLLAALCSLAGFDLPSLVVSIFLVLFGFFLMLIDVPGSPRWAGRHRTLIRRHFRFLTRLTFKSLFLIFLGCLLSCCLSAAGLPSALRSSSSSSSGLRAAAAAAKGRWAAAGAAGAAAAAAAAAEPFRHYALTDPAHGLQLEEFNRMAADATAGQIQFDIIDLGIVFNALDEHQKSAINEREFTEWMAGPRGFGEGWAFTGGFGGLGEVLRVWGGFGGLEEVLRLCGSF
ncbi:hypothetical protein, conserved [Eimeria tenella]|uniref:Uncharacterized protein n=1 Tax=Eimeria tenella TaxID=5802 RepID=U6KPH5_EIMTE|nr:hypothetical protein, conserved [Eimeria tenella]CDJ39881.1 hypothetical protein, conserved [Eimeria tenella]|eukprot:XP_013230634.1 hypothetical protein, conserved [Eimeria tenella]